MRDCINAIYIWFFFMNSVYTERMKYIMLGSSAESQQIDKKLIAKK